VRGSRSRRLGTPSPPRARPDFCHVGLPDLIRFSSLHAAPRFLALCSQTTRAHQQPAFAYLPQHTLAIHGQSLLPLQPPRHSPIAERQLFSTRLDDPLIVSSVGPAASRLVPVIQTRPADRERRRDQRGRVALRHHLARLGVSLTAAHCNTRPSCFKS